MRSRAGRRAAWVAGGVVVVALVLGGCSETGSPVEPVPTSASASPTPSATPSADVVTAPVRPAEMERTDEVGAVAAAEYFMELFAYVMASGDLTDWSALSDPECGFCSGVATDVSRVYGSGGAFTGVTLDHDAGEVLGHDEVLGGYAVAITFAMQPGAELDAGGEEVAARSAESGTAAVDVAHPPTGWRLVGLSMLPEGAAR